MNENEILIGRLNAELASLMSGLSANTSDYGDWKIIKIYEARLKKEADPYDFEKLSAKREQVRQRINEIQSQLAQLKQQNINQGEK